VATTFVTVNGDDRCTLRTVRTGLRLVVAGGLSAAITACASIAGLEHYSEGCADCEGTARDGSADARTIDAPSVETCEGESCAPEASPGGCDGGACDAATVPQGVFSCDKGGCNAIGGACSAPGQGCFCTSDPSCGSGKCVKTKGQNDVSCSSCSGAGAADGFGCQLESPGIPAACTANFGYTPSNLTTQELAALAPVGAVTLTCPGTVTYNGSTWSGATCSQTLPSAKTITQSGGPSIDVLAFQGLTIAAGVTLSLTGSNAVMLVVFGNASVSGTIRADAAAGASSSAAAGASGPGGNYSCGGGTGGNGMNAAGTCSSPYDTDPCRNSGGGGGGGSTGGGAGNAGLSGTGGIGGSSRANASLVPLYGGCPGGDSAGYACTTSGGGGGGAVQVSASGTLTIAAGASVSASGGAGGTSACSASFMDGGASPFPGGGGGGGSGGAVLLEAQTVTNSGTITVSGGNGGDAEAGFGHGAGSTSASTAGGAGTLSAPNPMSYSGGAGGGGGGGFGYSRTNGSRTGGTYSCSTTLVPAPACSSDHSACLCVDDTDCSSGRCVDSGQCTGTCTGAGAADTARCQVVTSSMTSDGGAGEASTGDASANDAGASDAGGTLVTP
jgi:hypothetical protein